MLSNKVLLFLTIFLDVTWLDIKKLVGYEMNFTFYTHLSSTFTIENWLSIISGLFLDFFWTFSGLFLDFFSENL